MADAAEPFLSAGDELADLGVDSPVDAPTPAAEGSALASLRERRERALNPRFDLEVPRYDPPIYVRYRAVSQDEVDKTFARTASMREKDRTVITNALILAEACIGIYEVIEGREVSIDPDDRDGTWPRFGKRVAELLGVRAGKSSEVVRALYSTDGDLISTAAALTLKSGYGRDQVERDSAGN